jgi:cysteinyl-tRNA synthetase
LFNPECATITDTETYITLILFVRHKFRKEKNYKMSDYIRDELLKLGVVVEDIPNGKQDWHWK